MSEPTVTATMLPNEVRLTAGAVVPGGVDLQVRIDVDPDVYGADYLELTEVVQMAVVRIVRDLEANQRVKAERRAPGVRPDHPVPGGLDG